VSAFCRVCGCADNAPCNPPCAWVDNPDGQNPTPICTTCSDAAQVLGIWSATVPNTNLKRLVKEAFSEMQDQEIVAEFPGEEEVAQVAQYLLLNGEPGQMPGKINEAISLGWQPWGGPSIFPSRGSGERVTQIMQAMVRYE